MTGDLISLRELLKNKGDKETFNMVIKEISIKHTIITGLFESKF